MQHHPFDRKARENRIVDLSLQHPHIAQSVYDYQYALDHEAPSQIGMAREHLRQALQAHMLTSDVNASLRLVEELHRQIELPAASALAR